MDAKVTQAQMDIVDLVVQMDLGARRETKDCLVKMVQKVSREFLGMLYSLLAVVKEKEGFLD